MYGLAVADRPRAFVLAELIVVLVVSSVIVVALLAGMVAVIRGLHPQGVSIAGETLPVAPGFGAFPSAVRLHQSLSDSISSARAVYVFGGRHMSIPADAPPTAVKPLKLQGVPAAVDFSPGLPMDSASFLELYSSALGETETDGTPEDFTVAVIGSANGRLAVTCLVQVRRRDISISDGGAAISYAIRDVRLWNAAGERLRYAFAERRRSGAGIFVGAVHTWLRYQLNAVREEGPACVVFPDPWVYLGDRGEGADIPPFSRFSYFLAISS